MKLRKSIFILFLALSLAFSGCAKGAALPEIRNAGFEDGIASWEKEAYINEGASVDAASDPERGAVAHISAGTENDVRLIQTLKVSEDSAYTISCYVKTKGVSGGAGANIGVYGMPVSSEAVTGDSDWTLVKLSGRTAKGQTELPISIGIGSHGSLCTGEAWFDDVRIESSDSGEASFGTDRAQPAKAESDVPTEFPTKGILLWAGIFTCLMLLLLAAHMIFARKPFKKDEKSKWFAVLAILLIAFAARVALSLIFYGHKTDINCFIFWGKRVIENGPAHFYDQWCDYPPGYMLVLGAMSWLNDLIGGGSLHVNSLLIKLPCIIADLAAAYLVYRYARKTMRESAALALMAVVAFTPVMAFVSSAWGQIDQALTLSIVIPILLLYKRRPVWAGLVYGLGIIMKPQALMCGPMLAAAYLIYVISGSPYEQLDVKRGTARLIKAKKDTVGLRLIETVLAVIAAFAVIILVSLPFKGDQGTFWLIEKYYGTATSYEYATVNAYNFWALIGANWKRVDVPFMGLTYGKWGTIFMAASIVLGIGLYVLAVKKHRTCKGALPLTMAFMLAAIFTFGHYMHERYIFPALLLLIFAYVFYNDWRILAAYAAYAATMLVNCIAAFYYSKLFEFGLYWDLGLIHWCSFANMVVFIWMCYVTFDLVLRNKPMKAFNG